MTGNEASFTLPSTADKGTSSDSMFCGRIFLLCTPLMKYNHKTSLTDIWHSGSYPSNNRDSLQLCHRQWQYILLLQGTKHQLSLLNKMPMVLRFPHACLIFQFRLCTVTEERFEKKTTNTKYLICHTGELTLICLPRINSLQHWPMSLPSQPSINF